MLPERSKAQSRRCSTPVCAPRISRPARRMSARTPWAKRCCRRSPRPRWRGTDMGRTLFEKIWDAHLVRAAEGEPSLLYIDLHLVHEVTSPQAFEGLRLARRKVRRPDLTFATVDHNVPTAKSDFPIKDPIANRQIECLRENCREFGMMLADIGSQDQGIV